MLRTSSVVKSPNVFATLGALNLDKMREDEDDNNSSAEQQLSMHEKEDINAPPDTSEKENLQNIQTIIDTTAVLDQYLDVHPTREEATSALERDTQTSGVVVEQQPELWGDDELEDTLLIVSNDEDDGSFISKESQPHEMHAKYLEEENGVLVVDVTEEADIGSQEATSQEEDETCGKSSPLPLLHEGNTCDDETYRVTATEKEVGPNACIDDEINKAITKEEESDETKVITAAGEEIFIDSTETTVMELEKHVTRLDAENDQEEYLESKEDKNEKSEEDKAEVSPCEQENDVAPAEEEKNYVIAAKSGDRELMYPSVHNVDPHPVENRVMEELDENTVPLVGSHRSNYESQAVDDAIIGGIFSTFLKKSIFNLDNNTDIIADDANKKIPFNEADNSSSAKTSAKDEDDALGFTSVLLQPTGDNSCSTTEASYKNDELMKDVALTGDSSSLSVTQPSPDMNNIHTHDHESVVRKLMEQIKLLEEHHSSELLELRHKHEEEINELKNEVRDKRLTASGSKSDEQSRKLAQNLQEKCELLQSQLKEQEDQTIALSENHNIILLEKEETIHSLKNTLTSSNKKIFELETHLQEQEKRALTTAEQYDSLKTRVKSVAQELKERRVECRSLSAQLEDVKAHNVTLKQEVEQLQKELTNKVQAAEDVSTKEMLYQSSRKILEEKISKLENDVLDERKKGEQALLAYKNKSVKALADAQRRVAAANQLKADSEAELVVLRANLDDMQSMLDQMSDRVEDRIKGYKENNQQLLEKIAEKDSVIAQVEKELISQHEVYRNVTQQKASLEKDLAQTRAEWENIQCLYQKEAALNRELAKSNAQLETDIKKLNDELSMIKDESDDFVGGSKIMAKKDLSASSDTGTEIDDNGFGHFHIRRQDDMVSSLQDDLLEANRAIEGLKEALRQALAQNKQQITKQSEVQSRIIEEGNNYFESDVYTDIPLENTSENSNNGEAGTALFYAFEKQAELNTARDEINRLANLIGEVQCEKQEALDQVYRLQKMLEETEAKLNRQCKLLGAPTIGLNNSTVNSKTIIETSKSSKSAAVNATEEATNAASANIEYLKHVMLRYLRARTTNEKRALLPVIAAVLCLTNDEKKSVERAVEESGGLSGMGNAFFESLETLAAQAHTANRA
jgi:hypothetical protein